MRLFDEFKRDDLSPSDFSEPTFDYLNRSGRPEFEAIRQTLEVWFVNYPSSEKPELQSRFRSPLNVHHAAAFFELFMHELLISLDCDVEVHPTIPDETRSPDFLARSIKNEKFYVEATVATFQSDVEAAAEARLNQVYDVLNRHVDANDFYLMVKVEQDPHFQPPGRKIAGFLNRKIKALDPDQLFQVYEAGDFYSLPEWKYENEGWVIEFRPIPKKPEARGKSDVRPLSMFMGGFQSVDHRSPLRSSIINKATAYGDLKHPFVIAVNALEAMDEIDEMEALFGKERFHIYMSNDYPPEVVDQRMTRDPDGVWTSEAGPQNTRVSAVLIIRGLSPWNIAGRKASLFHNPWARRPYTSSLTTLPQAIPVEGRMKFVDGQSFDQILNLENLMAS